jgi:diadenosine tetraphosphate (Ap4A) HIT family hydrolase
VPTMAASNASWCNPVVQMAGCELCGSDGGEVVVRIGPLRIVLVDDSAYPGFCRVIWDAHIVELTDLAPAQRSVCMQAVCQTEAIVREVMAPHKINLASLGNMTPHLHWHVIPRFLDDAHFPAPVWAAVVRTTPTAVLDARRARIPALRAALLRYFAAQ